MHSIAGTEQQHDIIDLANLQNQYRPSAAYTEASIRSYLFILTEACKFSFPVLQQIINSNIFPVLENLIPREDAEQPAYLNDLIRLYGCLLPATEELTVPEDAPDKEQTFRKALSDLNLQKVALYADMPGSFHERAGSVLLTKFFALFKGNINQDSKLQCIGLLDKIMFVLPSAILKKHVQPEPLAQLTLQVVQTGTGKQILICLKIVTRVFKANPESCLVRFRREGVFQEIKALKDQNRLALFDKEIPQAESLGLSRHPFSGNRTFSMLSSIFGGKFSEKDMIKEEVAAIESMLAHHGNFFPQNKRNYIEAALQQKKQKLKEITEAENAANAGASGSQAAAASSQSPSQEESSKEEVPSPTKVKAAEMKLSLVIARHVDQLEKDFFENEDLLAKVVESEFAIFDQFKDLAKDVLDEACLTTFNVERFQKILDRFVAFLVAPTGITSYEFQESGLLNALVVLMTKSPTQAQVERKKAQSTGTGYKGLTNRDKIEISENQSHLNAVFTQKDAEAMVMRLMLFSHALGTDSLGKLPITQLMAQCHRVVASNESFIFQGQQDGSRQNAFDQIHMLEKLEWVRVVYDPDGSAMAKHTTKHDKTGESAAAADEEMKDDGILPEAMELNKVKSKSVPPFAALQASPPMCDKSLVYQFRDRCFTTLKRLHIDIQHAENFWVLEERLKKVDTVQKAKDYSMDNKALRGLGYASDDEYDQMQSNFRQIQNEDLHICFEEVLAKIDQFVDSADTKDQYDVNREEVHNDCMDSVKRFVDQGKIKDTEMHAMFQMMQMEVEMRVQDHELQDMFNEDDENQELRNPEQLRATLILKMQSYGDFVLTLRAASFEYLAKKKEGGQQKVEEGGDKPHAGSSPVASKKGDNEDAAMITTHTKLVQVKPPEISQTPDESPLPPSEDFLSPHQQISAAAQNSEAVSASAGILEEKKEDDVEMTISQNSSPSLANSQLSDQQMKDANPEAPPPTGAPKKIPQSGSEAEANPLDQRQLEELINENNGSDVEIQFYFEGKLLDKSACFFEIFKQYQDLRKERFKSGSTADLKKELQEDQILRHAIMRMQRHAQQNDEDVGGECLTIFFRIVDRKQESLARKDSLVEYIQHRDRTFSQVASLNPSQKLGTIVQSLIQNEFSVFKKKKDEDTGSVGIAEIVRQEEQTHLENALIVLKILHFFIHNKVLFTKKGASYLLSKPYLPSDLLERTKSSLPSLSSIKPQAFQNSKIDASMLKAIQNPVKLITGGLSGTLKQIFSSCAFLFNYETKYLYFKLVSLMSVDVNRSLAFLRNYQKRNNGFGQAAQVSDRRRGDREAVNRNEVIQKFEVDRQTLMKQAISLMDGGLEKRKQLEVKFRDEVGTGLGPTLGFFQELSSEIFKAMEGKLWQSVNGNFVYPKPLNFKGMESEKVKEICTVFRLAGTFVAKSIIDDRQMELPISPLMWDILLDKKPNLFDLERFNPSVFKWLGDLQNLVNRKREIEESEVDGETKKRRLDTLTMENGCKVEDLCMYFTLPQDETIELVTNGAETQLKLENCKEYLDLSLNFIVYEGVGLQMHAFKKGFNSILPLESLRAFGDVEVLESVVCGELRDEDFTLENLKKVIKPDHGYNVRSKHYSEFLRYLSELAPAMRKDFVGWLTGCKRLPMGGFEALNPPITINRKHFQHAGFEADKTLPSVSTCHHYIKMPEYSSYEVLVKQFNHAILEKMYSLS